MRATTHFLLLTGLMLGLLVFQATAQDSLNVRCLGRIVLPNRNYSELATDGRYVYLAASDSGLRALDFADPTAIVELVQPQPVDYALGIALAGSYGYIGANCHGFHVVDLSDPTDMTAVGWCDPLGSSYLTTADPTRPYVYTVGDFSVCLSVIDVSVKDHPVVVWETMFHESGAFGDVAVQNERLYLESWGTLMIMDVSDPAHPALLDTLDFPGNWANGLAVRGNRIVIVSDSVLAVYLHESGTTTEPILQDFLPLIANEAKDMALSEDGNTAFVAAGDNGIKVYDLSDPTNVRLTGSYDSPGVYICQIASKDSMIFACDYDFCGMYCYSAPISGSESPQSPVAADLRLWPVYPNPFNAGTTIRYTGNGLTPVNLAVFDVTGRLVETLRGGNQEIGEQHIYFNASHLPTGTYLLRMESGEFSAVQKMILLK